MFASKPLRIAIVFLFLLLPAAGIYFSAKLKSNYDFDAFFPKGDTEYEFYLEFKERFESSGSSITLTVTRPGGVFNREFLNRVYAFQLEAGSIDSILSVNSILSARDVIHDPLIPRYRHVLRRNAPQKYREDSIAILSDPRMVNNYIDKSGKYLAIYLQHPRAMTKDAQSKLVGDIRNLLEKHELKQHAMVGIPVTNVRFTETNESEFRRYAVLATLLMLIAVAVMFRKFWAVTVAVLSVSAGQLIFFGFLGILGITLNQLSNLFLILMTISATSNIVHLISKYAGELRLGREKMEAIRNTIRQIGPAVFLTSWTTAVGLVSLATNDLPPIREFGIFAGIGIMISYATVMVFGLVMLSFLGHKQIAIHRTNPGYTEKINAWFYRLTLLRPRRVKWIVAISILICFAGISQISTNLKDTRDFPRNSIEKADYILVDSILEGIGSLDLALEAGTGKTMHDLAVLREIEKLELKLSSMDGVGNIYSPNLMWRNAVRSWYHNAADKYRMPDENEFPVVRSILEKRETGKTMNQLISRDGKSGLMMAKVRNVGSDKLTKLNVEIFDFAAAEINPELLKVTRTGPKWIFLVHQKKLATGMLWSLLVAVGVVAVCMAFMFRKFSFLAISMIPNLLPLLATGAMIGFLDFILDAKVAVTFTISFGIAVDDTIHFLSHFRIVRKEGLPLEEAIRRTMLDCGKPVTITTIVLFFGFAILTTSAFPPTFMIGFLIAATLGIALFADILLLPLLLRAFLK